LTSHFGQIPVLIFNQLLYYRYVPGVIRIQFGLSATTCFEFEALYTFFFPKGKPIQDSYFVYLEKFSQLLGRLASATL